ncbi:hypothetical protein PIB30_001491 [Stylosanthes scabra]|uniref:Transmembrane protein n=1 Tax=Stylosanthes scabra TaxID=79078 RepID=A0ABU6Q2L9_9FABA|nr:hypothetical protein [Stylosanthes scabra]
MHKKNPSVFSSSLTNNYFSITMSHLTSIFVAIFLLLASIIFHPSTTLAARVVAERGDERGASRAGLGKNPSGAFTKGVPYTVENSNVERGPDARPLPVRSDTPPSPVGYHYSHPYNWQSAPPNILPVSYL